MREIDSAIIHCSDSNWGDSSVIHEWHKERGWSGIGYHFVILNGHIESKSGYNEEYDGVVQKGRDIERKGAHCKGHNEGSIGICLIGKKDFSQRQLETLGKLIAELRIEYNITSADVFGHYSFSEKTCPNLTNEFIRNL